ncbi:MAG: aminoacyl-tRNA hydrolase, partial [bacterium]|nr:aminoacyl-tRNA hydrolase [bacterium]
MKQKLIIGLGNPGSKYEKTRHNAGFIILDALAREYGVGFEFKKKLKSEIAKLPDLILAKPQTFMNESGGAVSLIAKTYKLTPDSLLVVHDEIDLPLGQIRSSSGGSAGHKGVESIIAALGSGVSHLRIGIENRKEY